MSTQFSQNIMMGRKMSSLTQAKLANSLGVTEKSVARWERGESMPSNYETLERLAEVLKLKVWQLFHPDPLAAGKAERLRLGIGPDEPVPINTDVPDSRWSRIARERAARGISQAEASEERYCS